MSSQGSYRETFVWCWRSTDAVEKVLISVIVAAALVNLFDTEYTTAIYGFVIAGLLAMGAGMRGVADDLAAENAQLAADNAHLRRSA